MSEAGVPGEMRLRRLEIQGYKSFATRTVFEFDAGVTAIVGPNGSGKSNIMDALRWVMGETANKQMRAKRLEDVIFSGSETRAPAGLAEVTLTLDNGGRWLPLEFGEVAVTRRVHRDGESEFLINGNRVRLREIQELFTSSGLGQESYALMGQGLVEEMLRLKPEERRALIEEVADVRRHRLKMIDARRKREESHENLERARLLVEEIEPRMRTLERQAKRALQHAELEAELRAALRRYYRREWRRLQEELAARRAAEDQARARQASAERAVGAAEEAQARWEEELHAAQAAAEAASTERRARAERVRELEHAQEMDRQRESLLRARAEELRADAAELAAQVEAAAGEADPGEEAQAGGLEAEAEQARAGLASAETELRQAEERLSALRRRALAAEERLAALERAAQEDEARAQRLSAERDALTAQEAARAGRVSAARQALASGEAAAEAASRAAATAGAEAAAAREAREQLGGRFNAASTYLRGLEASRTDRERRLQRARDRLHMLRELQAESEGMQQGLRALFGSRGVPREGDAGIPGVVGVLRQLVRSPRGLEHAIEAALDEYRDAVIFESAEEALQTLHVLLTERAGRIVTIPLDQLRTRPPLALPAERGVIGVAAALVRCEDRHRALVDTLLGRTVVVEDEATARQIIQRGLGAAVTKEGHLFRPNGAVAGGRLSEQGAFGRENELQALPAEIEQLERALAESANVEQKRTELAALEEELRRAEERGEAAARARAEAQEEAAARRADVTRVSSELEAAAEADQRASARLAEIDAERESLRAAASARETERAQQTAGRPAETDLAAAEQTRESAAESAAAARTRLRTAEGERDALRAAVEARAAAVARAREQLAARRAQLEEAETEVTTLAATGAERESALAEARAALASTPDGASAEATALARLQESGPARREAVQAAQRGLIAAERELVAAEGAVRETAGAVDRLSEQMTADEMAVDARGRVALQLRPARTDAGHERDEEADGAPAAAGVRREHAEAAGVDGGGGAAPGAGERPPAGPFGDNGSAPGFDGADDATDGDEHADDDDGAEPISELREEIEALRGRLRWLGNVNPDAAAEFREVEERYDYLTGQILDLEGAEQRMLQAEADLGQLIRDRFGEAFASVDREFRRYFQTMFRGGTGRLELTDEEDLEQGGVEIVARPPGKRVDSLQMLSGGERSLTAMALLFAMLEVNPAPFSVLDEVDAALDEANVGRFVDGLKVLAERSQFVVITHNRRTIEQADNIYGITMGDDSVSRVLSVRLADLDLDE